MVDLPLGEHLLRVEDAAAASRTALHCAETNTALRFTSKMIFSNIILWKSVKAMQCVLLPSLSRRRLYGGQVHRFGEDRGDVSAATNRFASIQLICVIFCVYKVTHEI